MTVAMECAGNGRSSMKPKIKGTPWNLGAISQAEFTGTALHNVLDMVEISGGVREFLFTGGDRGRVHTGETVNYVRSLPVDIGFHQDTMLVWGMNGAELTPAHGYPLRLVIPGWYGMASVKWLHEITAINQPYQGFFQSQEYVYVSDPKVLDNTPVTNMRVRSLITTPENGAALSYGTIDLAGIAWSGEGQVEKVELSFDDGENWIDTDLQRAKSNYAFSNWTFQWQPDHLGNLSVISRATDSTGHTQPIESVWNKGGYGNNAVHRLHLTLG